MSTCSHYGGVEGEEFEERVGLDGWVTWTEEEQEVEEGHDQGRADGFGVENDEVDDEEPVEEEEEVEDGHDQGRAGGSGGVENDEVDDERWRTRPLRRRRRSVG